MLVRIHDYFTGYLLILYGRLRGAEIVSQNRLLCVVRHPLTRCVLNAHGS